MIAIITAMQEEAMTLVKKYNLRESKKLKNIIIFDGYLHEKPIILVFSGIGKIQASIATSFIFENYPDITRLINIGIAGNTGKMPAKIGDVFVPTQFVQSDMYLPFDGEHLDYAKKPIYTSQSVSLDFERNFEIYTKTVCATADRFVDDADEIQALKNDFGADICEMEAFAILSVAREYDKLDSCICIKSVSDGADSEAKEAHMNNLEFAMKNGIAVLEQILN